VLPDRVVSAFTDLVKEALIVKLQAHDETEEEEGEKEEGGGERGKSKETVQEKENQIENQNEIELEKETVQKEDDLKKEDKGMEENVTDKAVVQTLDLVGDYVSPQTKYEEYSTPTPNEVDDINTVVNNVDNVVGEEC
jgi:hypothetical protein